MSTSSPKAEVSQEDSENFEDSQNTYEVDYMEVGSDGNEDKCHICEGGKLLCCEGCPIALHFECMKKLANWAYTSWATFRGFRHSSSVGIARESDTGRYCGRVQWLISIVAMLGIGEVGWHTMRNYTMNKSKVRRNNCNSLCDDCDEHSLCDSLCVLWYHWGSTGMLQNSLCCTTPSYLGLLLFLGGKDFQFSLEGIHQELLVVDVTKFTGTVNRRGKCSCEKNTDLIFHLFTLGLRLKDRMKD